MVKQVFISYRRDGGEAMAQLIHDRLVQKGFSIFYDIESLKSGPFNEKLYAEIEACDDFILVLPALGLDRCIYEEDWVRKEIKHALDTSKNIVPVFMRGFVFPKELPDDIANIRWQNGVTIGGMDFLDSKIDKLISMLKSQPHVNNAKNVEKQFFDNELDKLMDDRLASRPSKEDIITPLQRIVENKLLQNYWGYISDRISPISKSDNCKPPSIAEGMHFSIPTPNHIKYVGYCITEDVFDRETLTASFAVEIMDQTEKITGYGERLVTFYIDRPDFVRGNRIALFGIDTENCMIYIDNGILDGNRVLIEKDTLVQKFHIPSVAPTPSPAIYSDITYSDADAFNDHWEQTTLKGTAFIIDLFTCTPVIREIYYDEDTRKKQARIHLKHNHAYFAFKLLSEGSRAMTNIEIGDCYQLALSGFPKDIFKAMEYYEKDDTAMGYYKIAMMFKNEPLAIDHQYAFEYMLKAATLGHRGAMVEVSEMLKCGNGCVADNTAAEKWMQKSKQIHDNVNCKLNGLGDIVLDGGVFYTR